MTSRIFRAAIALLVAGCVCQSIDAATVPIACKVIYAIDPGPDQFEITDTCVSPACLTQNIAPVIIPAGAKIAVKAFIKAKHKQVGTYTFTLNKALAPKESVRFDRKPEGTSCTAIASW